MQCMRLTWVKSRTKHIIQGYSCLTYHHSIHLYIRRIEEHLQVIRPDNTGRPVPEQTGQLPIGALGRMSRIEPHVLARVAAQIVVRRPILASAGEVPVVRPTPTAGALAILESYHQITEAPQEINTNLNMAWHDQENVLR